MKLRKDKWEVKKLGEVCEDIFAGGEVPKHSFSKIKTNKLNIPIFSNSEKNKGLYGYTNIKKVTKPSITISARGTIGYSEIREEKFYPVIRLIVVIPNSDVVDLFFLKFVIGNINFTSSGTSIPQLTVPMVKQYKIPLPPLKEQKNIAALFQSIENAMEQVDSQENNLLNLKNQLLRELFSEKKQFGNFLTTEDFEKVKFDKTALNISERVEPRETLLDTYVGLEHLDCDDLVIRRKGKPADVIGTKLTIYKGDIIFGKRRAYLRKVAVADFDGIVSAHSMVLRANEQNIEKDFLPYFMQSDEFMNRAVQISEGSLSPTIKWKTLAQQEFVLPKKEKQAKLIDVFKQFDETRELVRKQKETLKSLKQKLLNDILGG
jgi:type I restriction enzyme S subunit